MLGITQLFHIDHLSLVMIGLVGFVGLSIASFSSRYLKGDSKQNVFYLNLSILLFAVFIMVSVDHILLLLAAWASSNYFLTRLMLHKREWSAARHSSILALKNYGLGLIFLASAFAIFYISTGETSVQAIIAKPIATLPAVTSSLLLLLAAMSQSALWPFHRWLTSSSNSPTPVSAIMHAGLVNGGGFVLARFAPMLSEQPVILTIIFIVGITTALVGTLWKLMQSDIKRMLACSTMGQMGFMIAQCGLGLFPAAVAHLCWHGLFKAYLFLASGSVAQDKRLDLEYPPSLKHFMLAVIFGMLGAFMFSVVSGKSLATVDTTWFLLVLAIITGTQFALPLIRTSSIAMIPLSLLATVCMGALYGFSVHLIENTLAPLAISNPQPLNAIHLVFLLLMVAAWLGMIFGRREKRLRYPDWLLKTYVRMLNASQPHPKTVTAHRNQYQF